MITIPRVSAYKRALLGAAGLSALALAGCSTFPKLQTGFTEPREIASAGPTAPTQVDSRVEILAPVAPSTAAEGVAPRAAATPEQIAALVEARDIQVSLPPQPLPQFIDTVFGELLRVPYSTGPGVAQRQDVVALRAPDTVSSTRLFALAQMALAQYGLAVVIDDRGVRIIDDTVMSGQAPAFIRARSAPDTPSSSRSVMQFFAVSTLDVEALMPLLEQAYPNRGGVRFSAEPETNTLLISGSARQVAAAAAVVRELDQPHFANGQIARVEPVFLSPEQLADGLLRVLSAEGYRVRNPLEAQGGSLIILPVPNTTQMLVFAQDERLFERTLYWVRQLDRASSVGGNDNFFVYTARHVSAEELGALIAGGQSSGAETEATPPEVAVRRVGGRVQGGVRSAPAAPRADGITIDVAGNRILFRGSASEFERLRALLVQLDTPPQQVLIELTIAEVTLTDQTRFGVEWLLEHTIDGGDLQASTLGGSTRQAGGLGITATHVFSRGAVEAALNAFASNRNLNILSTPRIFTRSGHDAEILIGTDVPIITSQRASDNQTGGDTDVLQTVQYRQTGIILNVRAVVYGDRIDIALYQEVSSQQPNTSAAINSPLILNRSVTTQLSLQEGMTAVIGGLIQDNYTREQRGIPGLKDIPVLGAAFRSEEVTGDKVELLILVTPYIVRNNEDMSAITSELTTHLDRSLRNRGMQVYTLYPWRVPFLNGRDHRLVRPEQPAQPVSAAPPTESNSAPSQTAPAPAVAETPAPASPSPKPGSIE